MNRIQRNIDQIAANVALGYPPILFCFTATIIDTIHCIRPKNCEEIEMYDEVVMSTVLLTVTENRGYQLTISI